MNGAQLTSNGQDMEQCALGSGPSAHAEPGFAIAWPKARDRHRYLHLMRTAIKFASRSPMGRVTISSGNSSVGRAQPCQGWGREFESRFPLQLSDFVDFVRGCQPRDPSGLLVRFVFRSAGEYAVSDHHRSRMRERVSRSNYLILLTLFGGANLATLRVCSFDSYSAAPASTPSLTTTVRACANVFPAPIIWFCWALTN